MSSVTMEIDFWSFQSPSRKGMEDGDQDAATTYKCFANRAEKQLVENSIRKSADVINEIIEEKVFWCILYS